VDQENGTAGLADRIERLRMNGYNVLGSNTFDLLVCIPIGVLIAGAAVVNFSIAAPMLAILTLATVALFLMMRTHMILSRIESICLLGLYVAFVVWITLETFAVVDIVPSLPPNMVA
ncbi:hypothetical protein, partial [Chromatocurvus halotolerans]